MSKRTFKLWTLGLMIGLAAGYGLSERSVGAFSAGPLPSRTGAPTLGTFAAEPNCTQCHATSAVNSGPGMFAIGGLPQSYSANQEITVTVTLVQEGRQRYGFQLTALDDSGNQAGTLVMTDAGRTRVISGEGAFSARSYIEHTLAGTNQGNWSFVWRAPAASVGRVTFYAAGNGANGNGQNSGDFIYTTSASIQPAAASTPVTTVSAASFSGTVIAPDSIAAGYGVGLATGTESATTVPLPTTLAGTTVRVNERAASLFFVSGTQVNFLVPAETAPGAAATVTITSGSGAVSTGTLQIATVGPGLFTANTNGQGVPAAVLLRVRADGSTAFEPLLQRNAANTEFVPLPIDLGPETDQVFLILFGTGIRFRSALAAVTVSVGGTNAEVGFAGPADGFIGLDQVNARLPRSLAGRGNVDVILTVDGRAANTVTVNVR